MSEPGDTANASALSETDKQKLVHDYCKERWHANSVPAVARSLTFPLAVSYLALLRACEVREANILGPVDRAAIQFAPGTRFGMELLRELEVADLVAVSDMSDLDAFSFDECKIDGYYPYRVIRKILVPNPMGLVSEISDLALSGKWPEPWLAEAGKFWKRLAFGEAREYFLHTLDRRRMPDPDAARTDALIKDILRDHSVSQSYSLIKEAGKETSDQVIRKRLRGQQAASFMLETCQRNVDSARIDGRVIPNEQRIDELPQSVVSFVLHNVFLKIGEKGFTSVPAFPNGNIR